MKEQYDFIAIGDTVIDAFIKLKEASVHGKQGDKTYEICLPFAEKVPYEDVFILPAVGNAANAAVSASRLGLKTGFITNIGSDQHGKDCLASLQKDGVSDEFVKINEGRETNYHYVLWYGSERTILIKHQTFEYTLPDIGEPKWIYFSSVNENAYPFHNVVADYVAAHPNIKLAFQPGKFEIKLGKEKLAKLYQNCELFFCNVEEAKKILESESSSIKELLSLLHKLGPKIVVITDGPNGAYSFDGETYLSMPIYPDPSDPFERTGAGDAFASTFTSALALGLDIQTALSWGPINSMSVVQKVGAQGGLLSREQIEAFAKNSPPHYKASPLI
jgi:ribokinase